MINTIYKTNNYGQIQIFRKIFDQIDEHRQGSKNHIISSNSTRIIQHFTANSIKLTKAGVIT